MKEVGTIFQAKNIIVEDLNYKKMILSILLTIAHNFVMFKYCCTYTIQ
ncbi:MAG: hypothetical protein ACD_56C00090G0004 [uncultured bacterium]|nr:MAG: hypothetical protein ACD_56C00090G0004 [uncultured bacterium]